jgi:hypothetical protein
MILFSYKMPVFTLSATKHFKKKKKKKGLLRVAVIINVLLKNEMLAHCNTK